MSLCHDRDDRFADAEDGKGVGVEKLLDTFERLFNERTLMGKESYCGPFLLQGGEIPGADTPALFTTTSILPSLSRMKFITLCTLSSLVTSKASFSIDSFEESAIVSVLRDVA